MSFWIGLGLGIVGGGAGIWFTKDKILKYWHGAEEYAIRLRDKANTIIGR